MGFDEPEQMTVFQVPHKHVLLIIERAKKCLSQGCLQ